MGPMIKAEVGDTIEVVFKNLATRQYSIHPHGILYRYLINQYPRLNLTINILGFLYHCDIPLEQKHGPQNSLDNFQRPVSNHDDDAEDTFD